MMFCDSHVHVVADPARHPMIPHRTYTAGIAAIETLRTLGAPHRIGRFVVVQPSFYGIDNTVTLDALATLGADGAGVAVIDPALDAPSLRRLDEAGIRGLRINLLSTHGAAQDPLAARFSALETVAARMSWHIQVFADMATLVGAAPLLAGASVPVVIDHYGMPSGHAPGSDAGRALLDLVRRPHVWIKLSAPYRATGDRLGIVPDAAWLHALLEAAPGRCVWGSDWPHTPADADVSGDGSPMPYRPIDYAALVAAFRDAAGDAADRVMGNNPALLYHFGN